MSDLSNFSDSLAGIVEAAGASVVRVDARRRWPGSGVIWGPEGIIVTADHLVEREDSIEVGLPDGSAVPATLVGRDPTTDLAVVRVQASGLTPAGWGDPDSLRVGHLLLSIARPGRTARAAMGILSARGQAWRTPAGGDIDQYLQTDFRLAPGFSGSAMVDAGGRVRGLFTAGLLRRTSVAVPVPTLRRVVEMLLAHGRVRRGYLGVGAHPVRLPAALSQRLGQERGLLVVSVAPESPAEGAGLLQGDVLVSADSRQVHRLDDLQALLGADRVGATVVLGIVRAGQPQEIRAVVGERAA